MRDTFTSSATVILVWNSVFCLCHSYTKSTVTFEILDYNENESASSSTPRGVHLPLQSLLGPGRREALSVNGENR